MNYYAYIKGGNYNLIQGFTISEEYNETLDSGTIMISNVPQLDINPYDDVFIYSSDRELSNPTEFKKCSFYRHFLIDQFQEEVTRLGELFKYTISLFSETKGLENVQLPNISITQPLNASKKISTLEYIKRFLAMYNKMIKVPDGEIKNGECYYWKYKRKYRLAQSDSGMLESIGEVFKNSYTPDFTLNNPNLRDVLAKLLITKDRIPVVKDNYIYCLDITKRREAFNLNVGEINYIYGSKSSDNYCTDLRRNYSEALAQDYTGKYTEFLGFRNSDSPLLTLANMRIETKFPIYKINKLYMCYYKKAIKHSLLNRDTQDVFFLCKQDITPLVKLNSERNCLSEDTKAFNEEKNKTIETLSKYKLSTVGYDIGSNHIDGWGTVYNYPVNFFWQNETSSYIENIFNFMDSNTPFGISNLYKLVADLHISENEQKNIYFTLSKGTIKDIMAAPEYNSFLQSIKTLVGEDNFDIKNETAYYKSLFFEIEYQPFYSGVVIQSKEFGKENITVNDNASSSLTLLELDGLAQKEKINRFGNKGIQINARYTNIGDLQALGSVFEDDVIIYHKEYSINDNVVNCTYYGMKDYVLKNYFTTVYAKHRTYNLMSYGESITRCENERNYLLFSKTRQYYDSNPLVSSYNFNKSFCAKLLNFYDGFFSYNDILNQEHNEINFAYFKSLRGDNIYWLTDSNIFVSGNSLCMNMKMSDNVVAGVSIENIISDYTFLDTSTYVAGGKQKWVWMPDDAINDTSKTGAIKKLGFYFGHNDSLFGDNNIIINDSDKTNITGKYNTLFSLPQINANDLVSIQNEIGIDKTIYKDNKEIIDMTFQFEALNDEGIYLSPWIFKLSNLYNVYPKYNINFEHKIENSDMYFSGFLNEIVTLNSGTLTPILCMLIKKEALKELLVDKYNFIEKQININFGKSTPALPLDLKVTVGRWTIKEYNNIYSSENAFKISFKTRINFNYYVRNAEKNYETDDNIEFSSYYDDRAAINPLAKLENQVNQIALKRIMLRNILKQDNVDSYLSDYVVFTYISNWNSILTDSNFVWGAYPNNYIKSDGSSNNLRDWTNTENKDAVFYANFNEGVSNFPKFTIDFKIGTTYNQNLFFYFTNDDFKEYMVYDELTEIPITYYELKYKKYGPSLNNNEIAIKNENGDLTFYYNIDKIFNNNSKILIYYKKDNKYNFVFGFNILLNAANNRSKYTTIHVSSLSTKDDVIYDETHLLPTARMLNVVGKNQTIGSTDQSTKDDNSSNYWPSDFDNGNGGGISPSEKKIIIKFYNNINSTEYTQVEYTGVPTLIEKPQDPIREGYEFQYWARNGVEFDFENTNVYNDTTLYGVWTARNPVIVTYYAFGEEINRDEVAYGDTASKPQDPTRDGYLFKWWYENGKDEDLEFDFTGTPLYDDLNLNSKWVKAYKITYKVSEHDDVIKLVEENTKTNPPTNPVKEGYEFLGWYTEDDTLFDFDSVINSDIVLTAKFKLLQVKVTFYISTNNIYQERWIDVGTKVTKPLTDPTREGYIFNGWRFDFDTIINQNTDIYAEWTSDKFMYISLYSESEADFSINTNILINDIGKSGGMSFIRFYDATSSAALGEITIGNQDYGTHNCSIDSNLSDVENYNYQNIDNPATFNGLPAIRFKSSKNIGVGPYSLKISWGPAPDTSGDYWCILLGDTYYKAVATGATPASSWPVFSYASNEIGIRIEKYSVIEKNKWKYADYYQQST